MIMGIISGRLVYLVDDAFKVKYKIVSFDTKNETVTIERIPTSISKTQQQRLSVKWGEVSYV